MFKQHSFLQGLLILVAFGSQLSASIDWGGGLTRFKVGDEFASSENACAVLMSVVSGAPIDFEAFSPDSRADLITPGRELRDGANHNRILAVSRDFSPDTCYTPQFQTCIPINCRQSEHLRAKLYTWLSGMSVALMEPHRRIVVASPLWSCLKMAKMV